MVKNCLACGKIIVRMPGLSDSTWLNRKKYCSNVCKYASLHKGNVGRKSGEFKNCLVCDIKFYVILSVIKRGGNRGVYCSKKCMYKSTQRTKKLSGENNYLWKGDKASYRAKHRWVTNHMGKAKKCKLCGSTSKVEWSNVDHLYKRAKEDWQELCTRCHFNYDVNNKLRLNTLRYNHKL